MQDIKDIKLDVKEIKADIGIIKETMAANTASLNLHMSRTALNEKRIQTLEYWLLGFLAALVLALVKVIS